MQEKNTFKIGEIVYCINNTSVYSNTTISSLKQLELNKPYIIENNNGGGGDLALYQIKGVFYAKTRFISEMKYISTNRKRKILKLKERINGNR